MEGYCIKSGQKVLLLGEGNFSFSAGFLELNRSNITQNESLQYNSSVEIISTCFESDCNISDNVKRNVKFLEDRGVTVLYNVDATNLKNCSALVGKKFTKVIFNFPHVGGKMKIQLNRKLLTEFFLSSKDVLDNDGVILLTLCDGQGGTQADKNKRRWDDTWKVVEVGAQAGYALKDVFPFLHEYFPGYINTGYRSLDKGFHSENALTHVFKISKSLAVVSLNDKETELLLCPEKISTPYGTEEVSKVHSQKILQNPFERSASPHAYLFNCIKDVQFQKNVEFCDNLNSLYGFSCQHTSSCNFISRHLASYFKYSDEIGVFKGISLHKLGDNFLQPPVSLDVICIGNGSSNYAKQIVKNLLIKFGYSIDIIIIDKLSENTEHIYLNDWNKFDVVKIDLVNLNDNFVEVATINLDSLAMFLLHLNSWHELWAEGSRTETDKEKICLITPCLFPCSYVFDLSFSTQENFSDEKFYKTLWHVAGNIIFNVTLKSTYQPPDGSKNFCYRISYRSYEVPLFRKCVVDFQQNVIGKILEKLLNVTVL